jgi:hypothetical protein
MNEIAAVKYYHLGATMGKKNTSNPSGQEIRKVRIFNCYLLALSSLGIYGSTIKPCHESDEYGK